eukprot:gene16859-19214_t
MFAIFALSAHFLSVCSSPLTATAAGVLAARVGTTSLHEEDVFRLHHELLHFDAHTENRSNVLARVQQLFTFSQHVWLLSRDAVVAVCTEGAIRLLFAWVTGREPHPTASWTTLAAAIADATSSCTADPDLRLDDHLATWFLVNLPIELSSSWFLRHPQREKYYDAERFLNSPVAVRRQYILGFLYALSCVDHLHDCPLADDSILRFCIAHAGGVLQPDASSAFPFDERLVFVAPPGAFISLLVDFEAPSNAILRFSLTPLSMLRTAFQRHTVLSSKPFSLPQAELQRIALVTVPRTPALHSQARQLLPAVEYSPVHTFEPHPELAEVEDHLRQAYASHCCAHDSAAQHRALVDAGLPRSATPPSSKSPPVTLDCCNSRSGDFFPANDVPDPTPDHSAATGLFASLIRQPRAEAPTTFTDLVWSTLSLLHTLPHHAPTAQQFLDHVRRTTAAPSVGEFVVIPVATSTDALPSDRGLSWQELFGFSQACYRVRSVANTRFTADYSEVFYARPGTTTTVWPPTLCLPTPCPSHPELFVLRTPLATKPSTQGSAVPTNEAVEYLLPSADHLPTVRKHKKSRKHRRKKHCSDSESSDDSSTSSSSISTSPTKRHRPSTIEDDAGISVMYTKSSTLAQVRATTPLRAYNTDPNKPVEPVETPDWMDRVLQEQGNTLNNYTVDCITTGVIAIWRESFRALPHCALAGAAHMHPPVAQIAWFAYRHSFKELALNVILFNWVEFGSLTPTSLRLAHFLPLE